MVKLKIEKEIKEVLENSEMNENTRGFIEYIEYLRDLGILKEDTINLRGRYHKFEFTTFGRISHNFTPYRYKR